MNARVVSPIVAVAVSVLLLAVAPVPSSAIEADTPTLIMMQPGTVKQPLLITAGPSGAPDGFTIWWMTQEEYEDADFQFPDSDGPQSEAIFTGIPTLNCFPGESPTFRLAPNDFITVEIGDLADESGVSSSDVDELLSGTGYVFAVFTNQGDLDESPLSDGSGGETEDTDDCVFSQGYWKNHPENWPVTELMMGTVRYTYNQAELLDILNEPTQGNGLISMAHQLIATMLNMAMGADAVDIVDTVLEAHELINGLVIPPIGSGYLHPSETSDITQILDDFNNSIIGSGDCDTEYCCRVSDHACFPVPLGDCDAVGGSVVFECEPGNRCFQATPADETTWGRVKKLYSE